MIDERKLRELLERRAGTISATPTDQPKATRRARRRLALNATVGVLAGLAVVAGALTALRTIQSAPTPANRPTPLPSPAKLGSLAYGVDGDIYVAEWDGSNAVRIADGRPPNDCFAGGDASNEYWGEGPIWSPDGRYLAYRHANCDRGDDPPMRSDVVISDPEGNVVAEFPGAGWDISWAPDSTRVAVWVDLVEGTIGVFGVDGTRQALLTVPPGMRPAGDYDPMWLPDGESLLVGVDVVVPIDGSSPYHRQFDAGMYSPDGSRVAYVANRLLIVAEADGSNRQGVFEGRVWDPVWSPTGDRIAFTSSKPAEFRETAPDRCPGPASRFRPDPCPSGSDTVSELRVVDVATGTVTLLFEADGSDMETEGVILLEVIDFSPEGDRILFARGDGRTGVGSLWSVDADGSDARRLVAGTSWGDWLTPEEAVSPTTPRSSPSPSASPRDPNERLVYRVIEFARSPSRKAFAAIPLATDGVWLGLGDRLVAKRSLEELSEPRGWVLDAEEYFDAYVGPVSALDLLAEGTEVHVSVGPHPHCASPPVPPPRKFAGLDRVSVQPKEGGSCLQWFTVDFFVSADGTIQAVTLDLWEP